MSVLSCPLGGKVGSEMVCTWSSNVAFYNEHVIDVDLGMPCIIGHVSRSRVLNEVISRQNIDGLRVDERLASDKELVAL